MKRTNRSLRHRLTLVWLLAAGCFNAMPQSLPAGTAWTYTLVSESRLVDDCPICDRMPIVRPLRGTFELRLISENPLFATYAVENIAFVAGDTNEPSYKVAGQGTWRVGGEVALQQEWFLDLTINNGSSSSRCTFTNPDRGLTRGWPMLQVGVDQTNGTETQQYHLDLAAAPFRELWFSTQHGFKTGAGQPPANSVSGGDLVASTGRVVKRNRDLTARLGIMPGFGDLGLKAVDVLTAGEVAFALESEQWSETLGTTLRPGDVLSDRGRVIRTSSSLIAAFAPQPPVPLDVGLDALQFMDTGEILFSVATDFFSEKLGRLIGRGDLLSSRGVVIKANAELIARFHPAQPRKDYGLRAAYTWPSGEIWFTPETTFEGSHFDSYEAGDLLSDQGYVVYRNADLVAAFTPANVTGSLGLDALFLVSDVTAPNAASRATLSSPQSTDRPPANLMLQWKGGGRVFQLERAEALARPFAPVSPIIADTAFIDADALNARSAAVYRLRQW